MYGLKETPPFAPFTGAEKVEPDKVYWSGKKPPPAIGTRIAFKMNGCAVRGRVAAYFVEHGFLGVEVKCDNVPGWWNAAQRDRFNGVLLVFGLDLDYCLSKSAAERAALAPHTRTAKGPK